LISAGASREGRRKGMEWYGRGMEEEKEGKGRGYVQPQYFCQVGASVSKQNTQTLCHVVK